MGDVRQPGPRGTAFALRDPWPWATFAGLALHGESLGYAAVFLPEIAGRDAFTALAGLAGETQRIALGTGVVPVTARRPSVTAMAASTVHERSAGRMVLGLGTGPTRPGALAALESAVGEIRAAVGRSVSRPPVQEGLLTLDSPIPIWIAALGPRAVRLAGRIADGVLLNWCSPERVAQAREQLREGAAEAGRDPAGIVVGAYVRAAVGGAPDHAREALARAADEYASYPAYRRQFGAMGLDDVASIVDGTCLQGDEDLARRRLAAYVDAGCDLPVVYPVPHGSEAPRSVTETLGALGPIV